MKGNFWSKCNTKHQTQLFGSNDIRYLLFTVQCHNSRPQHVWRLWSMLRTQSMQVHISKFSSFTMSMFILFINLHIANNHFYETMLTIYESKNW